MEEMNLDITISEQDYFMTVEHVYPDFKMTMNSFICQVEKPSFVRKEHIGHKWLSKEELMSLEWVPVDLPIIHKL